jgi:hypothetical protein
MKKTVIILCVIVTPVQAQEETLISGQLEHGGYGGPVIKFATINNDWEVMVGGRGGWIINHSFVLGGGGYGLVTDVEAEHIDPTGDVVLELGYGGGMLEYVGNPNELIHYSVSLLIGAGGVNYVREITNTRLYADEDAFFVLEPEVNFMVNITTLFRAGVGAGYRLISGVDLAGLSDSDIGGLSINMVFKFGDY